VSSFPESKDLLLPSPSLPLHNRSNQAWQKAGPSTCSHRASAAREGARDDRCSSHRALHRHSECQILALENPPDQSNSMNYESACTWDICSLSVPNEMVSWSLSRISRGPWEEKITSTKSTSGSCA
jgi:hypothetical protein